MAKRETYVVRLALICQRGEEEEKDTQGEQTAQ